MNDKDTLKAGKLTIDYDYTPVPPLENLDVASAHHRSVPGEFRQPGQRVGDNMALPRKLKHLNLFNDGNNWQGIVESLTLPKFTRKYESIAAAECRGSGCGSGA